MKYEKPIVPALPPSRKFCSSCHQKFFSLGCAEDEVGGGGEVVDDYGIAEFPGGVLFGLGTVTGTDEDAFFEAGIPTAFQINEFVPDHKAFGKAEAKFVAGVEE